MRKASTVIDGIIIMSCSDLLSFFSLRVRSVIYPVGGSSVPPVSNAVNISYPTSPFSILSLSVILSLPLEDAFDPLGMASLSRHSPLTQDWLSGSNKRRSHSFTSGEATQSSVTGPQRQHINL